MLCEVPLGGIRTVTWHDGADQTSTAFAFAATARPMLTRDDSAIAAGWSARVVRRHQGAEAVRSYDETGAWTPAMEEAFAYGFVAFLRTAAWNRNWPVVFDWWRTQVSAMMAACPPGDEPQGLETQLDDAISALYGRVVGIADARGALPFPAPASSRPGPGDNAPAVGPDVRVRRRSTVIGEQTAAAVPPETHGPAMFSDLDQAAPRRLGPAVMIVGFALGVLLLGAVGMYFTVLRPSRQAATRAAETTITQLKDRKLGQLYEGASATLRQEKWVDFVARISDVTKLGKILETKMSDATIARDPRLGRAATVTCEAECLFGHATIVCTYSDVGFSGRWLLADVQTDVRRAVTEPPYAATDDGADALARRFVYAFQNEDYATITRLIANDEGEDKLKSFRESLIGDGYVTVLERTGVDDVDYGGVVVHAVSYDVETSREQRNGLLKFFLRNDGDNWAVVGVETNMRFVR